MMEPPAAPRPTNFAHRLPFFYGWVVIAIAFVTTAIGANARTSFSLLFPPILDEFGWSRGSISATFSIGFVSSIVMTPVIGALMDRYGPRWVLPLGAIQVSAGLALATISTEPWHFYLTLGFLVVGGSVFMSYLGHTLFLPNWFDRRRGLAIGIAFSGVGIGAIVLFPWMQHTIQSDGWRAASLSVALVVLIVLVPINFLFQRHRPEELGLRPDGDASVDQTREGAGTGEVPSRVVDQDWVAVEWTLGLAIKTARFWWLTIAFIFGLYVWYAVLVHQTRYLIDIGISRESAALALGLVGLTGVAGQIAIGHFSDRAGREWAWTLSLLGFMASYGCLLLLSEFPSPWLMYVMVGFQGFLGYGLASVFGAVPAELFAGKRYGVIFSVLGGASVGGGALGPYLTGVLHDVQGNYDQSFVLAMLICALSILAMWLAAPRKVRLVAGRVGR